MTGRSVDFHQRWVGQGRVAARDFKLNSKGEFGDWEFAQLHPHWYQPGIDAVEMPGGGLQTFANPVING